MKTCIVLLLAFICQHMFGRGVKCTKTKHEKRLLLDDIDVHQLLNDVRTLKQTVKEQQRQILSLSQTGLSGVVYTRWGRTVCPGNGTELVYSGYAGGGSYHHEGSAVNYVCLPHDPDFFHGDVSMSPWGHMTTMYGAEYEDNYFGPNLFDKDVPCAVCRETEATSMIMIPGKSKCVPGWKRQYFGRLAAGGDEQSHGITASSEYVCVDYSPEALDGGQASQDGKYFVPVKGVCGTLRCPPYKDNGFLTCVVCTK